MSLNISMTAAMMAADSKASCVQEARGKKNLNITGWAW